ncbi:MAG: hypothetical protein ACHBN1_09525 [Heteroscytonema crispum UTEX LB 1556]
MVSSADSPIAKKRHRLDKETRDDGCGRQGRQGKRKKEKVRFFTFYPLPFTFSCPMPKGRQMPGSGNQEGSTGATMPNAHCPMPNAHSPIMLTVVSC